MPIQLKSASFKNISPVLILGATNKHSASVLELLNGNNTTCCKEGLED